MTLRSSGQARRWTFRKVLVTAVALLLYGAGNFSYLSITGETLHALYLLPIVTAAWAAGLTAAIVFAALSAPLHLFTAYVAVGQPLVLLATTDYVAITVAYAAVALVTGKLSDLREQLGREIERRQRTESALEESEKRFALFMHHIPVQVFINDSNHRVLYVNQEHNRVYNSYPARGKHISDFLDPDKVRAFEEANERALSQGLQIIDATAKDPHGVERFYNTYLFPIPRDGEPPLLGGISIDLTEWREAQEKLKDAAEEKELLLREIHHRVRNNLSVIAGLIRLRKANVTERRAREICTEMEQRINAITVVHEKLYRTEELKSVDFTSYARDLGRYLLSTLVDDPAQIDYRVTPSSIAFSVEILVPLGIILTELVTNAIKHAFPNRLRGRISVSVVRRESNYELSVDDDGVGLPTSFDPKYSSSLGYQLITALTRQLNGSLFWSGANGTRVSLTFPSHDGDE